MLFPGSSINIWKLKVRTFYFELLDMELCRRHKMSVAPGSTGVEQSHKTFSVGVEIKIMCSTLTGSRYPADHYTMGFAHGYRHFAPTKQEII